MNEAHMIHIVIGTLCAGVTGISAAFVVYCNTFARKHLAATFNQEPKQDECIGRPAFQLARAQFQQN